MNEKNLEGKHWPDQVPNTVPDDWEMESEAVDQLEMRKIGGQEMDKPKFLLQTEKETKAAVQKIREEKRKARPDTGTKSLNLKV